MPHPSILGEFGDYTHNESNIPDPENQAQFEILNLLFSNGLLVVCTCVAGHASFVVILRIPQEQLAACIVTRPSFLKDVASEMSHLVGE